MNKWFGSSYAYDETQFLDMYKNQLEYYNPNDVQYVGAYVEIKTQIDIIELKLKYEKDSWQRVAITEIFSSEIYQMNQEKYLNKNEEEYKKLEDKYLEKVKKLDEGDWRYFVQTQLDETEKEINSQKELYGLTADILQKEEIQKTIKSIEINKQVLTWRLEKDIPFGNDYKNEALGMYQYYQGQVITYENQENLEHNEKIQYENAKSEAEIIKYDIENDKETGRTDSAIGALLGVFSSYDLFIIIIAVMIAGSILSDEFSKGTIKLLLVRPYSRTKVLLSKFVTVFIVLLISVIILVALQLVVGGITYGFDSYNTEIVKYNFNTNSLQTISVVSSLALDFICRLPMYILLFTLSFALGVLFTNSALSITIGILGYIGGGVLIQILPAINHWIVKVFPMMNWDFTQYLFGKTPTVEGLSIPFSIAICLVYFLIMIGTSFIIFRKKNIKNV